MINISIHSLIWFVLYGNYLKQTNLLIVIRLPMSWKSTIVTMFYNLKDLEDSSNETRTTEFYMNHGRGTLGLSHPMIIFCSPDTQPAIQAIRDELVDQTNIPTMYICRKLQDFDFYSQNIQTVCDQRKGSSIYTKSHRNTPSYCLLTMMKIIVLQMAYQRNPFHTEYFAWIDFGANHIPGNQLSKAAIRMLESPKPRVSVCYIHYRSKAEIGDMRQFVPGGPCGIAATAFTVEGSYMSRFYHAMLSMFHEQLLKGVAHSEETVLTCCYDRYPELFTLSYGDYNSVCTNYHRPLESFGTIRTFFIPNAQRAGRHDLAAEAASAVLKCVETGDLVLGENDRNWLRGLIDGFFR